MNPILGNFVEQNALICCDGSIGTIILETI